MFSLLRKKDRLESDKATQAASHGRQGYHTFHRRARLLREDSDCFQVSCCFALSSTWATVSTNQMQDSRSGGLAQWALAPVRLRGPGGRTTCATPTRRPPGHPRCGFSTEPLLHGNKISKMCCARPRKVCGKVAAAGDLRRVCTVYGIVCEESQEGPSL